MIVFLRSIGLEIAMQWKPNLQDYSEATMPMHYRESLRLPKAAPESDK
jgi:hypothetical protein